MLAALNSPGQTVIKAKKSRDHTENIFKYLGIPIVIKKNKNMTKLKLGVKNYLNLLNTKFHQTQVHVLLLYSHFYQKTAS